MHLSTSNRGLKIFQSILGAKPFSILFNVCNYLLEYLFYRRKYLKKFVSLADVPSKESVG